MSATTNPDCKRELICPCLYCLYTFKRSDELKRHINQHLICHHYRCPFCPKGYLVQDNALRHVAVCPLRVEGRSSALRERYDARYPLLRIWSLGMGLPLFKNGTEGDAEMKVNGSLVWECDKGSSVVRVQLPPQPTITEQVGATAV